MKRHVCPHCFIELREASSIKKLVLFLLKIVAVLLLSVLLLEGVLGLCALGRSYYGQYKTAHKQDKGKITILCDGDAFTWGLGGKSYPTQLQELLNARAGRDIFQVINTGVPDKSVGQSAREMPEFFSKYNPDALILLSGGTQEYEWRFAAEPPKTFFRRLFARSRVLDLSKKLIAVWGIGAAAADVSDWLKGKFGKKLQFSSAEELSSEIDRAVASGDTARCLRLFRSNRHLLRSSCEVVVNSAHKLAKVIGYDALEDYIVSLINADLLPPDVIQNVVNSYRFKVSRIELPVILRAQYLCELGIKKWPLRPEPYICAAEVCSRPGQYQLAEAYAKKSMELAPDNHNAYAMLADVYALQGEYDRAEAVIRDFPKARAELKRKILEIQFRSGKYDLAARNTERHISSNPRDAEAARLLATIYLKQRKFQKVASSLKRLLTIYPGDPALLYNLGSVYAELRQPVETRRYCQMAVDAQPGNSETLFSCQAALTHLGDMKTLRPKHATAPSVSKVPADGGDTWHPTPEAVLQGEIKKSVLSIYALSPSRWSADDFERFTKPVCGGRRPLRLRL